jgi:hypothetical protein
VFPKPEVTRNKWGYSKASGRDWLRLVVQHFVLSQAYKPGIMTLKASMVICQLDRDEAGRNALFRIHFTGLY